MAFRGGESDHGPVRQEIEWKIQDNRIIGPLSLMDGSLSTVVVGHFDFGPFSEHGMNVDDLQQHFKSDQLVYEQDLKKVPAHDHMKIKPFYMALQGCGDRIHVVVHGLSSQLVDENHEEASVSVCVYEMGGREIGCQDAILDDEDKDVAIVTIPASNVKFDTTIFAKTHAFFPMENENESENKNGGVVAKYATVTADYQASCTETSF